VLEEPRINPWNPVDHVQRAKRRYLESINYSDYKVAKYGAILLTVLLPFSIIWRPSTVVIGVLLLPCALTWLLLWLPAYRKYHRERASAIRRMVTERRQRALQVERIESQTSQIRAINQQRAAAWHAMVADLLILREQISARNQEAQRLWKQEHARIAKAREEIARRNSDRRKRWEDEVRRREAEQIASWRDDCERIEAQRKSTSLDNAEIRRQWESLMELHRRESELIRAHNDHVSAIKRLFNEERLRRDEIVQALRGQVQSLMDGWAQDARAFQEEGRRVRDELTGARNAYEQLKCSFERDRAQILGNAERNQLLEHLRQYRIEDAVIVAIGRTRKASLLAYGLETALDIHAANLAVLRGYGFGPELQARLRAWRASVEASFKFDPANLVLPEKLRTLHAKYQPRRGVLQRQLEAGPSRLRAITDRAKGRLAELQTQAAAISRKYAQAHADLGAMNP